jgi:hypothetical protein
MRVMSSGVREGFWRAATPKVHSGHINRRGIRLAFYPLADRGYAHHFPVARPLLMCKGRDAYSRTSHII